MSTIQLSSLGTFQTKIFADSAAEIVAFDPKYDLLFVTNGADTAIDILDASDPSNLERKHSIDLSMFGGGVNSVSVHDGRVAVAVEADNKQALGRIVFFDTAGKFLNAVTVGSLPDMVTFTPDGSKVLVANEGEPNDDYTDDPVGSVSIIDVSEGVENASVTTASFEDLIKEALIAKGVRVFGLNASVAQDLEPEYIAVSADSSTAWVTLQENNALAKVDLSDGSVEILPLGFKDHSLRGNELDASNKDGLINIRNWPVFGMYQPDSIATYQAKGKTYLVLANEGDSRIRPDGDLEDANKKVILEEGAVFNEEERVADLTLDPTAFPNAAELQKDENLGRLKVTNTLGDTDGDGDFDELYAYGSRSFSIRDGNGKLVFDSGADLEKITAILVPKGFNSDDEANDFDDRSDDKGPEPEAITVGEVDGRTYAFVGLERTGGIVVYDITNPADAEFVQYINTRDFESDDLEASVVAGTSGDVSPEGFAFISAADSPTGEALLAVANEISGSTTLYRINTDVDSPAVVRQSTTGDDVLYGTENNDEIYGLDGNDAVYAGEDNDYVHGGDGDDLILGEEGHDTLKGGAGNDLAWGGRGNDVLRGGKGEDNLYGNEGDDRLYGGRDDDFLSGGEGNDLLYGRSGDDFLNGGYGYDYFDGGSGEDTVTMSYRHAGVKIDLGREVISFFDVGGAETVRNVENAIGTEFGDRIYGSYGDNKLYGLGGDDQIVSGGGDDFLSGGDGDDYLDGGYGIDSFDGGLGIDTVTTAYRHAGVNIDLGVGSISFFDQGGQETLKNIENAIGTYYGDQIKGNEDNNRLEGLGGNDILDGIGSSNGVDQIDTLIGGYGGDTFVLGSIEGAYYDDGDAKSAGLGDYAHIADFKAWQGDVIQLSGESSQYRLGKALNSTGVFLKSGEQDELIAVVDGLDSTQSLQSPTFSYVS